MGAFLGELNGEVILLEVGKEVRVELGNGHHKEIPFREASDAGILMPGTRFHCREFEHGVQVTSVLA